MTIAILDPFSGIAGDMMLGALVDVGLDRLWLEALPQTLGIQGVGVRIHSVKRGEIECTKVDFDIPPQPHGRHISKLVELVERTPAPPDVQEKAIQAFRAIAEVEGELHGMPAERVHLHEVGAVDAILDVVGSIWGLSILGVSRVYSGVISLGDGFVTAAHGVLPVPAPATIRLLEGLAVRPGPDDSGELVTPTGAALIRVLSQGPPPRTYKPLRSGYGAGTRDIKGRMNALRIILSEDSPPHGSVEELVILATDLDDMSPEALAATAEALRAAGALDVVMTATHMKKGRVGTRLEVLAHPAKTSLLEEMLFLQSSTLGVRRSLVSRRALPRSETIVQILGHEIRLKVAELPNGGVRVKPEFEDVSAVSRSTGRAFEDVAALALAALERGS